jgi:hypothetical protein
MSVATDYMGRLAKLSAATEEELLTAILDQGFDQGCFLTCGTEPLVSNFAEVDAIIEAAGGRPQARAKGEDPFPEGRDAEFVPECRSGLVIVSQRCDLVTGLAMEPLAEVAKAVPLDSSSVEARAARLNSPRFLPLVEQDGALWVADLRCRGFLPKDVLNQLQPIQVVPPELRPRLRLRLGQRFSRDALPNALVATIQRPLIQKVVGKNNASRVAASVFTDWLLYPEEGRYRLIAVVDPTHNQQEGDDAYDQLAQLFPEELEEMLTEGSGAVTMANLSFLLWLSAMKINLDEISWHETKGQGHAEPTR